MLARLIKEEGEDIRKELRSDIETSAEGVKREIRSEVAEIKKRLDITVQPQLDSHASRIKALEYKTAKL